MSAETSVNDSTILDVRGLRKTYGGVVAIKNIDFELQAGEIHGLCGENGAGKSTLVKTLGGLVAPTEGEITVGGVQLKAGKRTDPRLISIVHQELSIIPDLTVLDNVLIGDPAAGEFLRRTAHAKAVRRQLDEIGLAHVDLNAPARKLSLAEQQLVEIARGVVRGAKILMLDEPTATLSDSEIRRVFKAVRLLKERGSTIVFISHRLPEVFELTDRITVFRNGERVTTRPTTEFTTEQLVQAMIGREVGSRHALAEAVSVTASKSRLKLRDFAVPGRFKKLSVEVGEGEVLAVVGQLGSGADAVVEAIAGLRPGYAGVIELDGSVVEVRSIADAIKASIAYVSEDRAGKGVFLEAPIETNIYSSILDRVSHFGLVRRSEARERARNLAAQFQIDARRLPHDVSTLSGGNQQKVSLAKAVALEPRVLILNEPTRGVDIGARTEIYKQLRELARRGMSLVFFTTDIEEVHELADRVITIFRGSVVSDRLTAEVSMDDVLRDILHGPESSTQEVAA
ncbi:ATP-binding cassette domain-containing protein [Ensifer sp. T173]|uniref:ATP-binding cassette domain-containing protein n=1 Tax=Ensifer canadensis TaxID=555315 RepID=A0AAW4FJZ8_9HYPH|nr:sugar ABC transporter ATP-binding protein [Ensifer canadensis]MBM3092429.1 ATP-binding cassette domain-containing protein [Ensifer canadensis]UBI74004.1 sugar ABC transporter ATP-binding protein [Ensifer canadensis]